MVISRVPRLGSVRGIKSKENGFGKFKEKFRGKFYPCFFVCFEILEQTQI